MSAYFRFLCLLMVLFLTGCGSKNYFVLLEDPDGSVGEITISNAKGSTTISEANRMVKVKSRKKAPGSPSRISERRIKKIFGEALDVQPEPAIQFLLYFKSGTTSLTPESEQLLAKIIETIKARKSVDTSVVGHSDTQGPEQQNNALSAKRAQAVADLLIAQGADQKILEITFHGEKNLLIHTADDVSEPKNRRVQVTVR